MNCFTAYSKTNDVNVTKVSLRRHFPDVRFLTNSKTNTAKKILYYLVESCVKIHTVKI